MCQQFIFIISPAANKPRRIKGGGRTLAFVEESYKSDILQIKKGALALRLVESSGDDNSPNLSPDASQFVFASNRTGNYEISIADADGKTPPYTQSEQNASVVMLARLGE